jgi:hypothetical protein
MRLVIAACAAATLSTLDSVHGVVETLIHRLP